MKVSVVIATSRDKREALRKTLTTLTYQSETSFEVHVVNDAGSPEIEPLVKSFKDRLRIYHHWSSDDHGTPIGAGRTRNVGIRASRGGRLLIVDDDCLCPSDTVRVHAKFGVQQICVIGFRRHLAPEVHLHLSDKDLRDIKKLPSRPEQRAVTHLVKQTERWCKANNRRVQSRCYTCHISYPLNTVKKIGGFWEEFTASGCEDGELGLRMWRAGCRFHLLHDPSVYHQDHDTDPNQTNDYPLNRKRFYRSQANSKFIVANGGPMR